MMCAVNSIKKIILEGDLKSLIKEVLFKLSSLECRRRHKAFSECYRTKQWTEAIKLGETIVKISGENEEVFRKLAVSYKEVGNCEYAQYYMEKSLLLRTKNNIEPIINMVEEDIFSPDLDVKSEYEYLGGAFNLGFIKHAYKKENTTYKYLTKIIKDDYPINIQASKERFFYQVLVKDYPSLKAFTIDMINYMKVKKFKLILITFEKLSNDKKQIGDIKKIINIVESLAEKIKYDDLVRILKIADRGRMIPISSSMHRPSTHRFIIKDMRKNAPKVKVKLEIEEIINRIEHIIIDLKLYQEINPKDHYVFCHRDLNAGNIIYDRENDRYNIIDWSTYGLGLRGHDATTFLCDYGLKFIEIRDLYLNNIEDGDMDINLKKIFSTYNLLIIWLHRLDLENSLEQMEKCIEPAVDYMQEMAEKFQA